MSKKILSMALAFMVVFAFMPAGVFAAGTVSDAATVEVSSSDEISEAAPVVFVKAKTSGSRAIKLSWNKVPGATKYVLYGQRCGKGFKKIKATAATSYKVKKIKGKKLKAHKAYKFYVVAYNGSKKLAKSEEIHFITAKTMGKYANASKVIAKYTSKTLAPAENLQLGATVKIYKNKKHLPKLHRAKLCYVSDNPGVASVNAKGLVTAKSEGTAKIYIQDISGLYAVTVITVKTPPEMSDYLSFTSQDGGSTIKMGISSYAGELRTPPALQYSTDKKTWKEFVIGNEDADGTVITLENAGDKVYIRTKTKSESFSYDIDFEGIESDDYQYCSYTFFINGKTAAGGNVMSLLDPNCQSTTVGPCAFSCLFEGCTDLTSAPKLPATKLGLYCYDYMFRDCSNLEAAPDLPATKLANGCYHYMFSRCYKLATVPELPAMSIAANCYDHMFYDCRSIATAPDLPATNLANGCYRYMFNGCTSLTTAPDLPATAFPVETDSTQGCYAYMFRKCSNLTSVTVGISDWENNTYCWLQDVAKTGTITCPAALSTDVRDSSHIPSGWTVVTK